MRGQYKRPAWKPLLDALGERLTGTFMWMQEVRTADRRLIQAYKHIHTRRYLYLDHEGRAYEHAPCGALVELRLDFAIEEAICNWWLFDGWEAEDLQDLRDAVVRASEGVPPGVLRWPAVELAEMAEEGRQVAEVLPCEDDDDPAEGAA